MNWLLALAGFLLALGCQYRTVAECGGLEPYLTIALMGLVAWQVLFWCTDGKTECLLGWQIGLLIATFRGPINRLFKRRRESAKSALKIVVLRIGGAPAPVGS